MKPLSVLWCKTAVEVPGLDRRRWRTEDGFQIYCADWLRKRYQLTRDPAYAFWHHSANERIGARQGFLAKMKGQGKGFPDFLHHGLRIALELKLEGNGRSKEQVLWHEHFLSINWRSELVFTFEDFRDIVLDQICKVRERENN